MAFAFPLPTLGKQAATHAGCYFPVSRFQICRDSAQFNPPRSARIGRVDGLSCGFARSQEAYSIFGAMIRDAILTVGFLPAGAVTRFALDQARQ